MVIQTLLVFNHTKRKRFQVFGVFYLFKICTLVETGSIAKMDLLNYFCNTYKYIFRLLRRILSIISPFLLVFLRYWIVLHKLEINRTYFSKKWTYDSLKGNRRIFSYALGHFGLIGKGLITEHLTSKLWLKLPL